MHIQICLVLLYIEKDIIYIFLNVCDYFFSFCIKVFRFVILTNVNDIHMYMGFIHIYNLTYSI